MAKFRVQVRRVDFFTVEVEADDPDGATVIAREKIYGVIPSPVPDYTVIDDIDPDFDVEFLELN